jgi:GT2 family glycosyltransferase
MDLSIVIPTYKRNQLLKKCLTSLVSQVASHAKAEIIVIDNSLRETAKNVVRHFPKVQYYAEKQLGLSFVRNTGWKKAKGKYVAYIDDDSIAEKDWVRNILKFIKKNKKVEVFGGPYTRYATISIPMWLPEEYGTMNNGNKMKILDIGREWLSGTNMIYKKALLEKMGGFDTKLGMKGEIVGYGEEADFLIRVALNKIPVYYDPQLKVSHLLPKRKINIIWLIKDSFIRGINVHTIQKKYPSFFQNKYQIKKSLKINLAQKFISYLQLICYSLGKLYAIFT